MFFFFLLNLLHVPHYKGAMNAYGAHRGVCGWRRRRRRGRGRRRGRHGRTHDKHERGVVGMDVDREGVNAGVGVGTGAVVMGVGDVVMRTVGVCTGGADTTVYEVVAVAPEVNHGAPFQIHSRRQRPGTR